MNKNVKALVNEADFCFWNAESWGPGAGKIDWSCDYEKEFAKFTELLIRKCIQIDIDNRDAAPGVEIAKYFGVEL